MEPRVIIVDDDPIAVFLLVRLLKHQNMSDRPLTFPGGHEVLEYLDKNDDASARYLVFLDINMPGMKGWELLDIIEKKHYAARIYFCIVSSSVDQVDHDRIQSYSHVIAFLEKPVDAKMLEGLKASEVFKGE